MLQMKDISKIYKMGSNVVKALDNVNFEVEEHEFVAIVGPSGSGKSTLMNMIGCLDTPTTGSYKIDNIEVSSLNDDKLADIRNRKIGFIFQRFNLLNQLSAIENVEVPLLYKGISAREARKSAEKYLSDVGLGERIHHKPAELSGGQQQRVAIARALAGKPPIILADEPTGNLDSKSGIEIMDMLKELNNAGNTIILITHDNKIAIQAKRIIRIQDGRIIEDTGVK
jgi:putative ABC transport system ATP-binding protein